MDWRTDNMKLQAEDILKEIADDLIIYLKAGKINCNSFLQNLNIQINNLEQLLRIHFLIHKDVKEFVRELQGY